MGTRAGRWGWDLRPSHGAVAFYLHLWKLHRLHNTITAAIVAEWPRGVQPKAVCGLQDVTTLVLFKRVCKLRQRRARSGAGVRPDNRNTPSFVLSGARAGASTTRAAEKQHATSSCEAPLLVLVSDQ